MIRDRQDLLEEVTKIKEVTEVEIIEKVETEVAKEVLNLTVKEASVDQAEMKIDLERKRKEKTAKVTSVNSKVTSARRRKRKKSDRRFMSISKWQSNLKFAF